MLAPLCTLHANTSIAGCMWTQRLFILQTPSVSVRLFSTARSQMLSSYGICLMMPSAKGFQTSIPWTMENLHRHVRGIIACTTMKLVNNFVKFYFAQTGTFLILWHISSRKVVVRNGGSPGTYLFCFIPHKIL